MQISMWRKSLINHINQTNIAHLVEKLLKMQISMRGKSLINHINQTNTMHLVEKLLKSHKFGHHKTTTFRLLKTLLLIYHFLVGQWLQMRAQIILCQILTYDIWFWSLYLGGLLVLIYVTFFHHIYDIDIWKLENVIPIKRPKNHFFIGNRSPVLSPKQAGGGGLQGTHS
jgi:hypothetical protein